MPRYVELHAQSAFSFLEAASTPEQLARQCADLDLPAMALTDVNGVYGSARFHYASRKLGLRAIVGAEVGIGADQRLTLLVETQQGYCNLCQLITRTKLRQGRNGKVANPIALPEDVALYSEGLVCLTGGDEGPLAHALSDDSDGSQAARLKLEELIQLFGPRNIYVELQRHGRREQEKRNEAAVELAKALGLPLLATNGVRYAEPTNRPLQDVLTCLRYKTTLEEAGRLLARNSQQHLKTAQHMTRLFADHPAAIGNTVELAARLNFTLENSAMSFRVIRLPMGNRRYRIYGNVRSKAQSGATDSTIHGPISRSNGNWR